MSEILKGINSIEDYAISPIVENNWLTRTFSNKMTGAVSKYELSIAKEIIRRKCLVGLSVDVKASIERFNKYFGWNADTDEQTQQCIRKYTAIPSIKSYDHSVEEGGMVWRILGSINNLDLELYEYILQLYEEQEALVTTFE